MTDENRRAAIAKELAHADQAYRAAVMLRDAGLFNDCLSRLYYALFHTMVALLLTVGVEPRRHRALPHLLGQHVSNVLTASEIAAVGRAATYRELADYERAWDADAEAVSEAFAEIDRLIKRARAHLVGGGWAA